MNASLHNLRSSDDNSSLSGHQIFSHPRGGAHHPKTQSPGSWHFDELTETSLLGAHFAQAVSIISHGDFDKILDANKKVPERKMIVADRRFNPHLEYVHISHDCEAHFREQERAWSKAGTKFKHGDRICRVPVPKVFVKTGEDPDHGTKVFGRHREIRPFSRVKKLHSDVMKHDTSLVEAQELRTQSIGPNTYRLPDPWQEMCKPVCGVLPESPVFKSKSKRLFDLKDKPQSSSHSTIQRASTAPQKASRSMQQRSFPEAMFGLNNGPSLSLVESNQSLESWNSLAFDKLGDNGSIVLQKPQTPYKLSRPSSPDLIITSLHPDSQELHDHLHPVYPDRNGIMSRSRSSEGMRRREQSHLPGPSFAPRLSPPRSPEQRQEDEDAYSLQKVKEWEKMNIDGRSRTATPPKSAPASMSNLSGNSKSVPSLKLAHRPSLQSKGDSQTLLGPDSTLSNVSSAPSSASYHKVLLSRFQPPLCYSKKPIHEQILTQQRLQLQQKIQLIGERGGPSLVHSSHTLVQQQPQQSKEIHLPSVAAQKPRTTNSTLASPPLHDISLEDRPHTVSGSVVSSGQK